MKRIRITRRSVAGRLGPGLVGLGALAVVVALPALSLGGPTGALNPALAPGDLAGSVLPAGFTQPVFTQGTDCVLDFDKDGVRDVLLSAHGAGWRLMKGKPDGTFVEVERLPSTDRHGCAVGDFGGIAADGSYTGPDGRPDIYTTIGACRGTCDSPFPNELWLQRPDGRYVPPEEDARVDEKSRPNSGDAAAYAFGIADEHGRGREPLAFDVNNDGLMDLFVGNDEGVLFDSRNRLYVNNGNGTFAEQPLPGGRGLTEVGSVCSAAADYDGNGWTDLLNCADTDYGRLQLYANQGGTLKDVADEVGIGGVFDGKDAEFADMNEDGRLDLVVVRFSWIEVRLNRLGSFATVDYQRRITGGSGLALGDADGDGHTDVLAVTIDNEAGGGADVLLRNMGRADEAGGWVMEEIAIPQTRKGNGDVATTLPSYNGTNRGAFVVNNGKWTDAGPWQFLYLTGPSTGPPEPVDPVDPEPEPEPEPENPTPETPKPGPEQPKPGDRPGPGPSTGGPGASAGSGVTDPTPGEPRRPAGAHKPAKARLTVAQLRINQRMSQAALRRARALEAVLDGRPAPPEAPAGKTSAVALTVRQLRINQRIAQAALRWVIRLEARVDGRPAPRSTKASKPRPITLSLDQLLINQRIAQAALRRVNALAARMVREGYEARIVEFD